MGGGKFDHQSRRAVSVTKVNAAAAPNDPVTKQAAVFLVIGAISKLRPVC